MNRDAEYSERSATWPTTSRREVRAPLRKAFASRLTKQVVNTLHNEGSGGWPADRAPPSPASPVASTHPAERDAVDEMNTATYTRRITSAAFCPPKPKLVDMPLDTE